MKRNICSDYINDIEKSIHRIFRFIGESSYDTFLLDEKTQQACLMDISIIGEISSKLINDYPNFIKENSQIPWSAIRNMRNRVIHGYFDINLEFVWATIKKELPDLLEKIPDLKISAREFDKNQNSIQKFHLTFGYDRETDSFRMKVNNQLIDKVLSENPQILNILKSSSLLSAYSNEQLKSGLLPKIEGKRLISITIDQNGKEIKSKDLER